MDSLEMQLKVKEGLFDNDALQQIAKDMQKYIENP
jgi:hypothetical protein